MRIASRRIELGQLIPGRQHALYPWTLLLAGILVFNAGGALGTFEIALKVAHQLVLAPIRPLLLEIEATADHIGTLVATPAIVHQILAELGMIATDVVDPVVIAASHGKADGKHDEGL